MTILNLKRLTIDIVNTWEYKGKTPSGRKWYYSDELDVCAYTAGETSLKICYNRIDNNSNAASSFKDCLVPFIA